MPIEIRELVIKVNIEENSKRTGMDPKELQELKNKLIRECTEKIMMKLENLPDR